MILPIRKASLAPTAAACAVVAALSAACAAPAPRDLALDSVSMRVMVKLVRPSEDLVAIGAEASRVAGVPITYAAAASASWHALALHCRSAAECDAAIIRLRGASTLYQAVEVEGRKARSAP